MKFLLFILIILSNVANAKETIIYIENKNYKVPLPSKFCDFSDTVWGIQLMDLLMKHSKMSSVAPLPQLVYRLCNSNSDEIFPWGYLGTKKNNFFKTQETFNKLKAKLPKHPKRKRSMAFVDVTITRIRCCSCHCLNMFFSICSTVPPHPHPIVSQWILNTS